jgi:hypothetical protein
MQKKEVFIIAEVHPNGRMTFDYLRLNFAKQIAMRTKFHSACSNTFDSAKVSTDAD